MEMRGRYVDGRHANAGAQYINSGGKRNNARFAHTGAVTATRAIVEGEEILYPYGAAYWRRAAQLMCNVLLVIPLYIMVIGGGVAKLGFRL